MLDTTSSGGLMHCKLALALALVPLALGGCNREPTTSTLLPTAVHPAGLVEITITGIGTPQQRASARSLTAPATGTALTSRGWKSPAVTTAQRLFVLPSDGTVEVAEVSTASFTFGTRGDGGYRYVSATFKVRNASATGVAYTTPRTNLTFVGVDATGSLSGTAIKSLEKFDGTAITTGLETQIQPTGWAALGVNATITASAPDILQVYTEAEVAGTSLPSGVTSIQPYGFVVRNPNNAVGRSLAANPNISQFDGLLTVAYKVPLQATPADDPFTITGVFLPVDDQATWVTQSLEDTDETSVNAVVARAALLGAQVRSVVGPMAGSTPAQTQCTVRSGGTASSPTGFLAVGIGFSAASPNPFSAPDSLIDSTASMAATFTQAIKGATASTFVVNTSEGGQPFLGGSYAGPGTVTQRTPGGHLWPGDLVEVSLTGGLLGTAQGSRVCPAVVYRYRVKAKAGSLAFSAAAGSPFAVGVGPQSVALGDFNSDGKLDLATANYLDNTVSVLLGDGTGRFAAAAGSPVSVGLGPYSVALGDLNGDGKLDIVTANESGNSISVLLGDGSGTFTAAAGSPVAVGAAPTSVALGDVNGDGRLDVVTVNYNGNSVSVLLGDGTGRFTAAPGSPYSLGAGTFPIAVALGDINGDGRLDIATANAAKGTISVLLGDGLGSFSPVAGSPFSLGGGAAAYSLSLVDVNGDGKTDIVTANVVGISSTVLLGNGSGGFVPSAGSPFSVGGSTLVTANAVALGDMNGDGKLEIITGNSTLTGGNVSVLVGDGAGGFAAVAGSPFAVGSFPNSVAVGDVNGDGKLDIVTANYGDNTVTVLLNP